eukprot:6490628-Karenia_brevis.AAC.1
MGRYSLHEAFQDPAQRETAMSIYDTYAKLDNGFCFRGLATHLLIDIFLCPSRSCATMLFRDQW